MMIRLECSASGLVESCRRLQCKGSNLFIGDLIKKKTPKGCNITSCVYRGHTGQKIHRRYSFHFYFGVFFIKNT